MLYTTLTYTSYCLKTHTIDILCAQFSRISSNIIQVVIVYKSLTTSSIALLHMLDKLFSNLALEMTTIYLGNINESSNA